MTIIELVRDIISNYPNIKDFTNGVHVDFTESNPTNYGLSSNGDTILKKDLIGGQKRKHAFQLYAVNQAYTDYDRVVNSNFLLELSYWLEEVEDDREIEIKVGNKVKKGKLIKMNSANGMLFDVPTNDINDGVIYQIQIYVEYSVKGEDL